MWFSKNFKNIGFVHRLSDKLMALFRELKRALPKPLWKRLPKVFVFWQNTCILMSDNWVSQAQKFIQYFRENVLWSRKNASETWLSLQNAEGLNHILRWFNLNFMVYFQIFGGWRKMRWTMNHGVGLFFLMRRILVQPRCYTNPRPLQLYLRGHKLNKQRWFESMFKALFGQTFRKCRSKIALMLCHYIK